MADVNKIIPFILRWEAGLSSKYAGLPVKEQFEKAKLKGYANDPDDLGGHTQCGVTLATFTSYRKKKGLPAPTVRDLVNISFEEWRDILKSLFWDRWKADQIENQSLALLLVDWVWGSGLYGVTKAQAALGVKVDGIVGPKTLAAVNGGDTRATFKRIHDARRAYFNAICVSRPANRKFLKGWRRRLDAITYAEE